MAGRSELGGWGETAAAAFLETGGYSIIERNYRSRFGEIDIIAQDGNYTAFVEVKLRKDQKFAMALEAVTRGKQAKIIAAAKMWLSENPDAPQPRFDIIEIYAPAGDKTELLEINHIIDAFQ